MRENTHRRRRGAKSTEANHFTNKASKQIVILGLSEIRNTSTNQIEASSDFRLTSTKLRMDENRCLFQLKQPRSAKNQPADNSPKLKKGSVRHQILRKPISRNL